MEGAEDQKDAEGAEGAEEDQKDAEGAEGAEDAEDPHPNAFDTLNLLTLMDWNAFFAAVVSEAIAPGRAAVVAVVVVAMCPLGHLL